MPVRPLLMDVTDVASIKRARRTIQRSAPGLDGIVCAAGIYVGGPLLDVADEDLRRVLDVNVLGAAQVVRELMPLLRHGSTLAFVSSESTRAVMPFTGPYVMSKRALEAYAETLRRELLPLGIRVTVIQPGAIRTPLLGSAARSLKSDSARAVYRGALRSAERVLLREMETGMDPSRVARVIVRALERRRPRRRRRVGNNRLRAFVSFLPASWIDAFLRRFLGRA
jgi:NAD(P)-dependent dehydrogenase (short-subunit alcohol dehydrogenase family)